MLSLAACSAGGLGASRDNPYAPAVDPRGEAVDGLIVGHRLMEAGQYDLALKNFTRAAGEHGLTGEVLVALGSANLALGRLNQSEELLRRAVKAEPDWPEAWNNLGVVLMERRKIPEASEIFKRAYALDNGESDAIRDNLRLALEKVENSLYDNVNEQDYKLVRRGSSQYLIRRVPG
ncbi:tetratricopeptide repeat protein [Tropicibacter naphthalenivorans]|uniref:Type IV pilus biogenesis/stability protein PilW n=1 Tax=Tropicibacter naphthalenivorans TaxID=441103 RepID=A0A0P1G215_9RHOB|nr:tetratricopeptide repeat protein [Tropicibacter naphthalenivorans]CUH75694.1 type IV pilus biogenesis/stability protein PilW [Tropicibacter naphthalenivorans]SMC42770.1 Tetratricopeptide repeat-containing protein [Tropicibacter naphthalenivorans]